MWTRGGGRRIRRAPVYRRQRALSVPSLHGAHSDARGDEQYERLYVVLFDAKPFQPEVEVYEAGVPETEVNLSGVFDELMQLVAERKPDFYEVVDGNLHPFR